VKIKGKGNLSNQLEPYKLKTKHNFLKHYLVNFDKTWNVTSK